MRSLSLALCFIAISGCQTTSDQSQTAGQLNPQSLVYIPDNPATPQEVYEALTSAGLLADLSVEEPPQAIEYTDLWQRMQSQLSFVIPQNRAVISQRNWYAKHQEYLDRVSLRATPFLYFIVEELERRQMPIELALLPIVESAFDPFAYSHGRASGMWQFIPGTAERFGLKHNWWYDGRRDVIESTHSALDYLSFLHKTLEGDWLNAIAAYNSGEGRILRAIKKNKRKHLPTDFWSLDLPKETAAYVPKLLALAELLQNPTEFNISWKAIPNEPQIAIVDAKSQIDIAVAAELADISVGELHGLNPGYSQWATAPNGPHTFIIPLDKAEQFKQKLAATPAQERIKWQLYTIKKGDTLGRIAQQYNTSVEVISAINKIKGNMINQGKQLFIPTASQEMSEYTLSQDQRLSQRQNTPAGSFKIDYIVKKGDTFWDISREYKVNIRSLSKWNNMAPTDPIHPGQRLAIWQSVPQQRNTGNSNLPSSTVPNQIALRTITYKVRRGDSLARIANKFNIQIDDIAKWNQINTKALLQPGQKLKLFVDVTKA